MRVRRAASAIRSYAGLFVDKLGTRFFNWAEDGLLHRGGVKRECGEELDHSDSASAPATVSGERLIKAPLGLKPWEGDERRSIREPGDLPSVLMIRESRAGCPGC